jgi:preprotein translocase subunit YajC
LTTILLQPAAAPPGRTAPADQASAPPPAQPSQPAQSGQPAQPAQPTSSTQAAPAGDAGAPAPQSPGAWSGMMLVLPFLLLFGLLFLMNRGEKKKRVALESKLKRGDKVVTRSGIKGKLVELSESTCKVEISPGVNVIMLKVAIEGLDPGETPASAAGKDAKPAGKDSKEQADGKDSKDKKK